MDVYHKALVKLYEATGGRDTLAVDFKELVKGLGFLGNYGDITQKLNSQGWIAEASKENYVKITHWGVKEAQKALSGEGEEIDTAVEIRKNANRLRDDTKQFLIMIEEFAADVSKGKFEQVEKKFAELNTAIAKLKESI